MVPTGPPVPAPTAWLDSPTLLAGSLVLLLLSLGVGTPVALWAGGAFRAGGPAEPEAPWTLVAANEKKETSAAASQEPKKPPAEEKKKRGEDKPPHESVDVRTPTGAEPRALTQKELHKRLLQGQSVVWIYNELGSSSGSGSVIHRGRRLIITNQHVVQKDIENARGEVVGQEVVPHVWVLFPQKGEGDEWISDKKYYESLLINKKALVGRVLKPTSGDPDLALIQLESELPQECVALQLAPQHADVGDNVMLIGNAGVSSGLWSLSPGSVKNRVPEVRFPVRFRNRQGEVEEREVVDKRTWCLETSIPSHPGDSGSPVLNDRGQLVGVHYGSHPKSNLIKYAVDRNEVLAFLAKFGIDSRDVEASDVLPSAGAEVVNLIKLVEDGTPAVCRKGVDGLRRLNPVETRRAVPALVRALQRHEDETLRRVITELLNAIGPPVKEDLDCLSPAIRLSYTPARAYVVDALGRLGTDARHAVPVLAQALKDRDSDVRRKAAKVLGDLGPLARRQAFRTLLATASAADGDEEVAKAALDALINLEKLTSAEIDLLIEALDDDKRWVCVRRYAAFHLGALGPQAAAAVPALTRALQTARDDNLLAYAARALGNIGEKKEGVLKALVGLVCSRAAEKVRVAALEAVTKLDLSAFSTGQMLRLLTEEKNGTVGKAVAQRLGERLAELKPEQMADVRPLLQHTDPDYPLLALRVILNKKSAAGVEQDVAYLARHADAQVAARAMDTLRALGPAARTAVPSLLAVLSDVPRERRLDVALAATVGADDPKVAEAVLPPLLEGLRPGAIKERGEGGRSRIHAALVAAGQPAVEAIFKTFETISYRGADNIDYRQNLFLALRALGPSCRSADNHQRLKRLRDKEVTLKYTAVIGAAQQALAAMDPN
jgi:HEAT repeat protein/S1-C subfamily serine protease